MTNSINGSACALSNAAKAGVLLIGLFATVSCDSATAVEEFGACRQTHEFGNYGCAEVSGRVLGSQGQPLIGVSVGPRYLAEVGPPLYDAMYVETDAQGRFRFRVTRYAPRKLLVVPDTFSLYVSAAVRPNPGTGAPSSVVDSVLVQVELAPIGAVPRPAEVEIRLSHP